MLKGKHLFGACEIYPMDVWLWPTRLRALLTSAIEVYNRETDGVFAGLCVMRKIYGKKRKVLLVDNVYPFQTSERKPSEVSHGNIAAFTRVMNFLTSSDVEFLGGYHSHPYPYRGVKLSKSDVEFINDELAFIRKSRHFRTQSKWLELLICIKKKKYARKRKPVWRIDRRGSRAKLFITIDPYTAYSVIIAAFWIDFSKEKPVITETEIHVPWHG